jgi:hypothetical protein
VERHKESPPLEETGLRNSHAVPWPGRLRAKAEDGGYLVPPPTLSTMSWWRRLHRRATNAGGR